MEIHGVQCGNLCESIRKAAGDNMKEVRRLMSHIIFLPKYYIHKANTKVQTYNQLHENGFLPDNWADIHIEG